MIGQGDLETGRLCQVYPEPVAATLVGTGLFRRSVAQVLLDVSFVNFGIGGEAGAE